jgi:hypothetical protein
MYIPSLSGTVVENPSDHSLSHLGDQDFGTQAHSAEPELGVNWYCFARWRPIPV